MSMLVPQTTCSAESLPMAVAVEVELNGLKEITGGTRYNSKIEISAANSGSIRFPNLTTIFDPESGDLRLRQINLKAQGLSSEISIPKLESAIDQSSDSVWSVSEGATLNTPLLKYLAGTEISVDRLYSTLKAKQGGEVRVPQLKTLNLRWADRSIY